MINGIGCRLRSAGCTRAADPRLVSVQLEDHEHRTDGGDNVGHGVDGDALHQDLILSSRM